MKTFSFRVGLIAGAMLAVGACAHNPQKGVAPAPALDNPTRHGFSEEGLENVQAFMDAAVEEGRIPSAIAMAARDGKMIWHGTAGEMGPGVPMRADAIVPLASVGKMYTATAAMILYERGLIALDDPVGKFIPEFADVKVRTESESGESHLADVETPITIFHLLTHTGGIKSDGDDFWAVRSAHAGKTTTSHFARALAQLPLQSQPGAAFSYGVTGASYEVLAAVIETVSGQTLEDFMVENIFQPLGLDDTYFYIPDEKSHRLPAFYRKTDAGLQMERAQGEDFPRSTYFHGGGGGVMSAPADILKFARLFIEGGTVDGARILNPETVELMMRDHLGEMSPFEQFGGALSWGFGAAVLIPNRLAGGDAVKQYGWVGGNYARLWVDPSEKLVGYFAFTLTPPGDIALLLEFDGLVYGGMTQSHVQP